MCGIAGLWDEARLLPDTTRVTAVERMSETLRHRGPDGSGQWQDAAAGLCLAHRRLSILDLSPTGAQPMVDASGRWVIVYNGEIYNHQDLRREMEASGGRFRGHSDTEVIIEACRQWGIDAMVDRLVGMFAMALWDVRDRRLTLVRDRIGVKPLYWGRVGGVLAFGSELKALRMVPGWRPDLDRESVAAYLRLGYVPAPRSIHRGIFKLEPGTILSVESGGTVSARRYWDARRIMAGDGADRSGSPDDEVIGRLDDLLRDAVARRMVADVPVGGLLSGGIDSSLVVALMQAASPRPVHTFTIGFDEADYDEARHAAAVARHLGTDHAALSISPRQAREVIPHLPHWYDEPFGDSSQISTALVSHLARGSVTVALSGDGGDEVFAGYSRYLAASTLWQPARRLPGWVRRAGVGAIESLSPARWDWLARGLPGRWRPSHFGERLHKLAAALCAERPEDYYRALVSHWPAPEDLVLGGREPGYSFDEQGAIGGGAAMVAGMQLQDLLTYLPDDILTKVDRASMAVGLEVRVPLLDHRVVTFAGALPLDQRLRGGTSKWLLRRVLDRYVPRPLVDRPKMGFGVPIDAWLRGPLRPWAEALLDPGRLRAQGLLAPEPITALWRQHCAGTANRQTQLWNVLMLQAWLEHHTGSGG